MAWLSSHQVAMARALRKCKSMAIDCKLLASSMHEMMMVMQLNPAQQQQQPRLPSFTRLTDDEALEVTEAIPFCRPEDLRKWMGEEKKRNLLVRYFMGTGVATGRGGYEPALMELLLQPWLRAYLYLPSKQ